MPRKSLVALLFLLVLIGLFFGLRVFKQKAVGAPAPAPVATTSAERALPVYTFTVQAAPLDEKVDATGSVLADESVDLTSEVAGVITAINFEEGAKVGKGDLLFKINDADLQAELERAQAQVALAKVQAERQQKLLGVQGASQEAYDVALNELKVLEAEADLIRARLAKTSIHAPFGGRIGLRFVSEGAYLTPGTRVATLQNLSTIKVEFNIAEHYMDRIQHGAKVQVKVVGSNTPFEATVYAIEPRIDEATRTIRLRARAENQGERILPGAFATVSLPLRTIPDALCIPTDAVIPGLNQQTVYIVEDGKAAPRIVQTGIRLANSIQIVSGLSAGDVVITSGQLQIRPGMAVEQTTPQP